MAWPTPSPRSREVFLSCGDRHHDGYRNLLCLVRQELLFEHLIPQALFVEKALSHSWRVRMAVGLLACLYNAWARRRDASVQLCSCLIAIALGSYFLQKSGAGVDINARFDLVIAVAMGLGLAFTQILLWPVARPLRSEQAQAILLLAVCVRLLASKQLQPVRLVFDRSFINDIAMRERAMTDSVERVRRIPAMCCAPP